MSEKRAMFVLTVEQISWGYPELAGQFVAKGLKTDDKVQIMHIGRVQAMIFDDMNSRTIVSDENLGTIISGLLSHGFKITCESNSSEQPEGGVA